MTALTHVHAGSKTAVRYTLEYVAPEVAACYEAGNAQERASSKVDVWALGVVAYELLTKRTAFPASLTEAEVRPSAAHVTTVQVEAMLAVGNYHTR